MNNEKIKLINYPNPFNPETTISYDLPVNIANPVIEILNIKGEKVKTLCAFSSGNYQMGTRSVVWNGKNSQGKTSPTGIYFYKLNVPNSPVRKMIMIK